MDEKIIVVGFGRVGQANGIALRLMGKAVFSYDPNTVKRHYVDTYSAIYTGIPELKNVRAEDGKHTTYLVCVSDAVFQNGTQDISSIRSALEELQAVEGTVILRSTILPDHLADIPRFDFYVPEFLHERQAVEQSIRAPRLAIGSSSDKPQPPFLRTWIKNSRRVFLGTPQEVAHIKYLTNVWNAARIALTNELGTRIAGRFPESLQSVTDIIGFVQGNKDYQRFGRAYGGRCLPKDVLAYLAAGKSAGHDMVILEGIHRANELHKERSDHAWLPRWFSEE